MMFAKRHAALVAAILFSALLSGCITVRHEVPEPIRVELDITIRKVDEQLDSFFDDIDSASTALDASLDTSSTTAD